MISEELLSFRKQYWTNNFPIEARYYQFGAGGPSLTSRLISSAEELREFQSEASRQEQSREWSFIAYYDPCIPT